MASTAAMIAQVRRWVNEPTSTTYNDASIAALIEQYPLQDERGVSPYYYDVTSDPPTQVATVGWYPTYDLRAAAADIWDDKAAALAERVDRPHQQPISGYNYETQPRDFALAQARYHRSKRVARTGTLIQSPSRRRYGNAAWIGNLPEED